MNQDKNTTTEVDLLDKFVQAIKDEFKDENWDYLDFIAERVRNKNPELAQENTALKDRVKALEELERNFYLNVCRAYNAGKSNMMDNALQGDDKFISSHDYFVGEFPEFKTNVP